MKRVWNARWTLSSKRQSFVNEQIVCFYARFCIISGNFCYTDFRFIVNFSAQTNIAAFVSQNEEKREKQFMWAKYLSAITVAYHVDAINFGRFAMRLAKTNKNRLWIHKFCANVSISRQSCSINWMSTSLSLTLSFSSSLSVILLIFRSFFHSIQFNTYSLATVCD